jgi:hypothetical protein
MKTKEQIKIYNKEYFARPEVIARAKIRNAERKDKRKEYKKTDKGKEANKRYRQSDKCKLRIEKNRLKSRYGITLEDYEEMVIKQNGICAICGVIKKSKLHIDHNHTTGEVRGLLCGSCNRALGLMKDNTEFLLKAIKYLNGV